MWITVLGLAIAVNFEPIRLGLLTVALNRPRPALQLLAFLSGSFAMSATAGLIVLFVVRPGLVGTEGFDRAQLHMGLGALALVAAILLTAGVGRRRSTVDATIGGASEPERPPIIQMLLSRGRGLTQGSSPWFSGAMGIGIAIPSIDYLALLILIAASDIAPTTQAGLLFTFIAVANAVVAAPIVSLAVAPDATRAKLQALRNWVSARTRRDLAIALTAVGAALIAAGIGGL